MTSKDFGWASKYAIMDMVAYNAFNVDDKIAVLEAIENLDNPQLENLGLAIISCDNDIDAEMILESLVVKNPQLSYINEKKFSELRNMFFEEDQTDCDYISDVLFESNRNKFLQEEGENNQESFSASLKNVILFGSVSSAIALIMSNAQKNGYQDTKKGINSVLNDFIKTNKKAYNTLAEIPVVRTFISGSKVAGKDGKKIFRYDDAGKLVSQAKGRTAADALINKNKHKFKNVKGGARSFEKNFPQMMKTSGKILVVAAGITAVTMVAYKIFKNQKDVAVQSCRSLEGSAQKECELQYRIKGCDAAIYKLDSALQGCDQKSDPEKCKHSLQSQLWNWRKRKKGYQAKLGKPSIR
jgi:hypothetical protein